MREIKFRVWCSYHKKYFTLQERASRGDIMPRDNELKVTTNYELILEQFTGLQDINGVDIYEGDICTYEHEEFTIKGGGDTGHLEMDWSPHKGVVTWELGAFRFELQNGIIS